MHVFFKTIFFIIILLYNTGCSYRSSNFFEDIIADNETVKADGRYSGSVPADKKAPILKTRIKTKEIDSKKNIPSSNSIISQGKIVQSNFDKDYNLYVYTFLDEVTNQPVTFFYDKSIHYSKSTRYKIVVNGNYLYKIEKVNGNSRIKSSLTPKTQTSKRKPRRFKKRRRSFIKAPIEEKINTL